MEFLEIFKKLNKKGIKYLVAGGVAVNLHGYVRATADLDIMLLLEEKNVCRYISLIEKLGFKPRMPVSLKDLLSKSKRRKWINKKGMKVFSVYNPKNLMEGMDILIKEYVKFNAAYKRRKVVNIAGTRIPLISIEDLIKLKKCANRGRDLIDIAALKEIKHEQKNKKSK